MFFVTYRLQLSEAVLLYCIFSFPSATATENAIDRSYFSSLGSRVRTVTMQATVDV